MLITLMPAVVFFCLPSYKVYFMSLFVVSSSASTGLCIAVRCLVVVFTFPYLEHSAAACIVTGSGVTTTTVVVVVAVVSCENLKN